MYLGVTFLLSIYLIYLSKQKQMYCDNQTTIFFANNLVFTKHIKVDFHFIQDKLMNNQIVAHFVHLDD